MIAGVSLFLSTLQFQILQIAESRSAQAFFTSNYKQQWIFEFLTSGPLESLF